MKYVAYYRVSTDRQGRSGLGLEAQQEAVRRHIGGGALIEEFIEVESGGRSDRPQLTAALALCREQGAPLVIAKLDRLARSVHFISGLMESKVDFVACDFPDASRLTLHIMAAVAEHERRQISERTKAALAAARRRGVDLGANGRVLAARYRKEAVERARGLAGVLSPMRAEGLSLREMAERLNVQGVPTPSGRGRWHAASVGRTLGRIA